MLDDTEEMQAELAAHADIVAALLAHFEQEAKQEIDKLEKAAIKEMVENKHSNMINHPPHYTHGAIECIDALRAALSATEFIGFLRGNAIKYLWRAPHKNAYLQDLDKAIWYINRLKMELSNGK